MELTLAQLKQEIKEVYGTKSKCITPNYDICDNLERNYRPYCKSDKAHKSIINWAWEYYN